MMEGRGYQQPGLLSGLMEALLLETKALGCFASLLLMIGRRLSHVVGVN